MEMPYCVCSGTLLDALYTETPTGTNIMLMNLHAQEFPKPEQQLIDELMQSAELQYVQIPVQGFFPTAAETFLAHFPEAKMRSSGKEFVHAYLPGIQRMDIDTVASHYGNEAKTMGTRCYTNMLRKQGLRVEDVK